MKTKQIKVNGLPTVQLKQMARGLADPRREDAYIYGNLKRMTVTFGPQNLEATVDVEWGETEMANETNA
jgi:hypothetical protein